MGGVLLEVSTNGPGAIPVGLLLLNDPVDVDDRVAVLQLDVVILVVKMDDEVLLLLQLLELLLDWAFMLIDLPISSMAAWISRSAASTSSCLSRETMESTVRDPSDTKGAPNGSDKSPPLLMLVSVVSKSNSSINSGGRSCISEIRSLNVSALMIPSDVSSEMKRSKLAKSAAVSSESPFNSAIKSGVSHRFSFFISGGPSCPLDGDT